MTSLFATDLLSAKLFFSDVSVVAFASMVGEVKVKKSSRKEVMIFMQKSKFSYCLQNTYRTGLQDRTHEVLIRLI